VGTASQARAVKNYRKRLRKRGLARFEVLGLEKDRDLVRAVARRLAEDSPEAEEMRTSIRHKISEKPTHKENILEVLRSWPLAELNLTRPFEKGRKIEL
jgi:hypothetical protein